MNNVYKLFALIMENLGQVAGKIDELYSLQSDMETALSSINEALNNLADLPNAVANINTELTTIGNRLDALEGGEDEGGEESPIEP
jgi:DNA repair ATPase RecN